MLNLKIEMTKLVTLYSTSSNLYGSINNLILKVFLEEKVRECAEKEIDINSVGAREESVLIPIDVSEGGSDIICSKRVKHTILHICCLNKVLVTENIISHI